MRSKSYALILTKIDWLVYRLRITLSLWQVLGWIPALFTLDTVSPSARYSCDVSTELHCLGGNWPLYSIHASALNPEYSEDLILFKFLSYSAPKIATEGTFHLVFLKQ